MCFFSNCLISCATTKLLMPSLILLPAKHLIITQRLCFVGQIVWINPNAVPSNKSRLKKVKNSICSMPNYCFGIYPNFVKNNCQFVYDYVESLSIFDHLCSFSYFYTFCLVGTSFDYFIINSVNKRCNLRGRSGVLTFIFVIRCFLFPGLIRSGL